MSDDNERPRVGAPSNVSSVDNSTTRAPAPSSPEATLAAVDSGWWGDDGEAPQDEDDEEDDESENESSVAEPPLPDERLDPVAFAAASAAREARDAERRQHRKERDDARRARRKARALAQRSNQKSKQPKAGQNKKRGAKSRPASRARQDSGHRLERDAAKPRPDDDSAAAVPAFISKTNAWMLGLALLVFTAAAIFAAVVSR